MIAISVQKCREFRTRAENRLAGFLAPGLVLHFPCTWQSNADNTGFTAGVMTSTAGARGCIPVIASGFNAAGAAERQDVHSLAVKRSATPGLIITRPMPRSGITIARCARS